MISFDMIARRDRWQCQICGCSLSPIARGSTSDLAPELDHRIAKANGGGDTWDNLQLACRRCNLAKKDGPPQGQLSLWPTPTPTTCPWAKDERAFTQRRDSPTWRSLAAVIRQSPALRTALRFQAALHTHSKIHDRRRAADQRMVAKGS